MKTILASLLLTAPFALGDTRFAGTVKNLKREPIADLTLHFYRRLESGFEHRTVVTSPNGSWQIILPDGEWRGAANTDDVLARGYFCIPGFVWCGGSGELCGGEAWPPLWGGGVIDWPGTPITLPEEINLTVIPTRPELQIEKPRTRETSVRVSFETTTVTIQTVRQWRIEKSTDLQSWTALSTVALSGPSPVLVPDPESEGTEVCYYRAVQIEDIIPSP